MERIQVAAPRGSGIGRRAALACALALAGLTVAPAAAHGRTVWLCKPGARANPCESRLDATVLSPSGRRLRVEKARPARRARIDCFYVYPTVSDEQKPEADLRVTSSERAIALFQAARLSQRCRVWAPVYRQVTLFGLLNPGTVTSAMQERAYADVKAAWREYLRRYNRGRGVVLIGHSQGTFVLRRLVREEIDPSRKERRRLVSALLLGGNVTVRSGADVGGDFKHVRACRSATQTGCVVAYSMFNSTPPANSLFGRVVGPDAGRLQVLCTNPAALSGGSGALDAYLPTARFPGLLGVEVNQSIGALPQVSTPWVKYEGAYRASCSSAAGANVLHVEGVAGAHPLLELPDATWGLHLGDVNLALGNLTDLVRRQTRAYLRGSARARG
ncbi:MAG: DUF3089 domain-containing protein [Thermoleophilaceae bacterium]|nr:DUF3089 domain-containing protein [Thermoleophilaceae bacterium]